MREPTAKMAQRGHSDCNKNEGRATMPMVTGITSICAVRIPEATAACLEDILGG